MHSLEDASQLCFLFFLRGKGGLGVMAKMKGEPMRAPLFSHRNVFIVVWRFKHTCCLISGLRSNLFQGKSHDVITLVLVKGILVIISCSSKLIDKK